MRYELNFDEDKVNDVLVVGGASYDLKGCCDIMNEQQSTIDELQSIINHIKCEENCEDYDYCCETVCSLYNEIKHLKEENEQLKQEVFVYKKAFQQQVQRCSL